MNVYMLSFFCMCCFSGQAVAYEVCFDDLGCFDNATCHALGFPPDSPEFIDTRFFLYTRMNQYTPQELVTGDVDGLRASNFDPSRKTKFSVHGWHDDGFSGHELDRKDAFLEVEDANVIVVDWRVGADQSYSKSSQDARVVGREIGLMVRFLNLEKGMYYKDVQLVGMSLGGQVVGYAGEFQPGLARITGLDPAGPLYRDEGPDWEMRENGPECRLDPSDAIFVDVIHTDGNDVTGQGQMLQLGHQDYYPNGGRRQPGCTDADVISGCSHSRAWKLFAESIRSTTCDFTAYPCGSWAQFAAGDCNDCGANGCPIMGYRADENTAATGTFYLYTNAASPYCIDPQYV